MSPEGIPQRPEVFTTDTGKHLRIKGPGKWVTVVPVQDREGIVLQGNDVEYFADGGVKLKKDGKEFYIWKDGAAVADDGTVIQPQKIIGSEDQ